MSIFSLFTRAFTWLKNNFTNHIVDADKVAVFLTETAKTLLANPVNGFLLNMADAITSSQVPTNIANTISGVIPKILAVELAIEGLPDNPTEAQVLAFEQSILSAFSVNNNNSKLYTELGAQIYGIIQTAESTGNNNFAGWVDVIEAAYADLQKDLNANAVVVTPPHVQYPPMPDGTTTLVS